MEKKIDILTASGKDSHMPVPDSVSGDITPRDFAEMRNIDIREADWEVLTDILEIKIDSGLSDIEKKREFIRQIKNPYLYRQGEYIVKLSFADTEATLTDCLKAYIEHIAAAGLQ